MTTVIYYQKLFSGLQVKLLFKEYCFLLVIVLWSMSLNAQTIPVSRRVLYSYSVINTPYGDYFGKLILNKESKKKEGEIIDEDGKIHKLKILKFTDRQLIFVSYIDNSKAFFDCCIVGDSLKGTAKVKGDDFKYILNGVRIPNQ